MIIDKIKNIDHEEIFAASSLPAYFTDAEGGAALLASGAEKFDILEGDERVHSKHIKNGRINWIDDTSRLDKARERLFAQRSILEGEEKIKLAENKLAEDREKIKADEEVLGRINELINPRLEMIKKLMTGGSDDEKRFAAAAFLGTYVKHRSRFELKSREMISMFFADFAQALHESFEFLKLCGISCELKITEKDFGNGRIRLENAGACYDWLQGTLEDNFSRLLVFNLSVEFNRGEVKLSVDCEEKSDGGTKPRWAKFSRSFGKAVV